MQETVKILAVDDVTDNLTLIQDCLCGLGLEIAVATSGEEALEYLDRHEVALILLDVKLPGIDGFEMASRVRERESQIQAAATPILFNTCSVTEFGNTHKAYALDAIDFLFKPFDPSVMRTKVSVLTQLYRQRRQIEQQAERLARSEEALRRQTVILQSILDSMGDGVVVADDTGKLLLHNPAAAEMCGEAIPEQPIDEWLAAHKLYHADKQTPFERDELPLVQALRGVKTDNVEVFLDNPNIPGGVIVRAHGRPVRDASGILIGGVVSFQDITEQQRDQALKDAQRRMLEQLAVGCTLPEALDGFARVVEAQSTGMLCSVLLLSADGKHLLHGAAPNLPPEYTKAIDGIEIGPTVGSCGTAAYKRESVIVSDIATDPLWDDYRQLALEHDLRACWSQPILALDGELLGTFAIYYRHPQPARAHDLRLIEASAAMVSSAIKRKQADERLESYSRRLASSNQELQNFVSVASHDLQEPLRKIRAFGDRLKIKTKGALGADAIDYVDRMLSASARMQSLIDNLLELSRVQSKGRAFLTVDLNEIAREVVTDLEICIDQSGGTVALEHLEQIEADPTQMRQLLQNLISNALKYHSAEMAPVVKVYGRKVVEKRNITRGGRTSSELYQIFVEDNGIGFDEQYLDRIFGVFQRLHNRTEFEGTGIGLALCRRIAERHHGYITARSRPSKGSTFIVTLPVKHPEELTW